MNIDDAMSKAEEALSGSGSEAEGADTQPVPDAAAATPAVEATGPSQEGRARGPDGKFTAAAKADKKAPPSPEGVVTGAPGKAPEGQAEAGGVVTSSTAPPAKAVETKTKPPTRMPQNWSASHRELAARLPEEFHPLIAEAVRVDEHVRKALNESTDARQFAQEVRQRLSPFEGIARANGMDSVGYAESVLQTASVLHMGTQQQRDMALAMLIQQFGGTVDGINGYLSGYAPQGQTQQHQPQVDVNSAVARALEEREQAIEAQRNDAEVQEFLSGEPEFINDVWEDMVAILQAAASGGRKMTYEQAYDKACRMNEDVSKVLDSRRAGEQARTATAATEQAQAAAVSIKSTPAAPVRPPSMDVDSAIRLAAQKHGM